MRSLEEAKKPWSRAQNLCRCFGRRSGYRFDLITEALDFRLVTDHPEIEQTLLEPFTRLLSFGG